MIIDELFTYQDLKYRDFHSKLIPNIDKNLIIGVRTPILRKIAKRMVKDGSYKFFIKELPHKYYDENTLHSCILSLLDIDEVLKELDIFLPYIDNWATCDLLNPKSFKSNKKLVLKKIKVWLKSKKIYTIRFAIVTLLNLFLDDDFNTEINDLVKNVKSNEYYVNMARAWYFSYALIKQYDSTINIFIEEELDEWTHNKSLQKAIESYRIKEDRKMYLRSLKK